MKMGVEIKVGHEGVQSSEGFSPPSVQEYSPTAESGMRRLVGKLLQLGKIKDGKR